MANRIVDEASLTALGDTIREKGGTSDLLSFPDGMRDAILAIPSGSGWEQMVRKSQAITGSSYISKLTADGNDVLASVSGNPTSATTAFTITLDVASLEAGAMYELLVAYEKEGSIASGDHVGGYFSLPVFIAGASGSFAGSRFGGLWIYRNGTTNSYRGYATHYGLYGYRFVPSTGVLTVYIRYNSNASYGTGTMINCQYRFKVYKRKLAL